MRAQLRFGARTGEMRIADELLCGHFRGPLAETEVTTGQLVQQAFAAPNEAPPSIWPARLMTES